MLLSSTNPGYLFFERGPIDDRLGLVGFWLPGLTMKNKFIRAQQLLRISQIEIATALRNRKRDACPECRPLVQPGWERAA